MSPQKVRGYGESGVRQGQIEEEKKQPDTAFASAWLRRQSKLPVTRRNQRVDFVLAKSNIPPSVCLISLGTHKARNCTHGKPSQSFTLMNSCGSGKSAHYSPITARLLVSPPSRGASHVAQALGCHVTLGTHILFTLNGGWLRFGVPAFTSSNP